VPKDLLESQRSEEVNHYTGLVKMYSLRVGGRAAKKEGKETCVSTTKLCLVHLKAFTKQCDFQSILCQEV